MNISKGILAGALMALAAGAIAPADAEAAQVVRFKTGFELLAVNVRFEGEMAILTLEGGSEVGFPRWALEGVQQTTGGPHIRLDTYGRNRVKSSALMGRGTTPLPTTRQMMLDPEARKILAQGTTDSIGPGGVTIGYSLGGQQQRFSAGPAGPVNPGGRIGDSLSRRLAERRIEIDPETGMPIGKPKIVSPTLGPGQDEK